MTLSVSPVKPSKVSVFKIVPPQDGGWSLMPMENLLRGLGNSQDMVSLELFGVGGVISYGVRAARPASMSGMFTAYFPQADVSSHDMGDVSGEVGEPDLGDWMRLGEDEFALVQTLGLERESYLPLRIFDDREIQNAATDPLAGLIGTISSITSFGQTSGSNRMGVRLLIRPAPENWSLAWQNRMQARRDGEDRSPRSWGASSYSSSPSSGMALPLGGLIGFAGINWLFFSSGNVPGMVLFNGLAAVGGLGGLTLWRRMARSRRARPYLDEALVEEKLKALGFLTELQIVRFYGNLGEYDLAQDSIEQVVNCLRSSDDPAGNSWQPGRSFQYSGESVARREYGNSAGSARGRLRDWLMSRQHDLHPFAGGSRVLGWLDPRRAGRTVLSAREAASVWHLPLGMGEMASMERIASGSLIPYLGDLSSEGEDSGPKVGTSGSRPIFLPESSIQKHGVILGRSGVGKSTLVKHIVGHKLKRKAEGKDDGSIVVIDPHADLVRDILTIVPQEIVHKVRLLDFGRMDRVPGINLVDPNLFPDRDRCVDTIVNTIKHLFDHWGGRLEDLLKNSLLMVYEFNQHEDTDPDEMLTMLDILSLLEEGTPSGGGGRGKKGGGGVTMSPFQRRVVQRVRDPRLKQWFQMYLGWPAETRAEAVGPVHSRVGAYASNQRASVVMGQRKSTIMLSDVLQEGLVLLVSTAQGTIGRGPAALMGGTMVSLVESALRSQESVEASKRAKCLLVCDEFQTVTGADWEGMLAEDRKYGCSILLATQSLVRLQSEDRNLKAGVLGNVGVIIGYQMSAEDARIISYEMDAERVPERYLVNLHPHHCCVRINSSTTCYPAFSMKTLPPPDMLRDREEAERAAAAVLESSREYTVDYAEVRARLDAEMQQRLDGEKLDPNVPSVSDDPASLYGHEESLRRGRTSPGASGPEFSSSPEEENSGPVEDGVEVSQLYEAVVADESAPVPVAVSGEPSAAARPARASGRSPLSKISEEDLEKSQLSPAALSYIREQGTRDPALRVLVEDNNKYHIRKAYEKANKKAEEIAEQVVREREGDIYAQARADALVELRAEVAAEIAGPDASAPRDVRFLRRPGSEESSPDEC